MKYSYAALVLATATIGQVVAGPVKHAHQHLHKKNDEVLEVKEVHKRNWEGVNFATVIITYSKGQTWGDATSAPAAAAATTPPVAAAAAKATTPAAAAPSSSSADVAAASVESTTPKAQNTILTDADRSRLSAMGAQIGANSVSNNGGVWIGSDGPFTGDFVNSSGEDIIVVCWGPWASWVNAKQPYISHSLASGASVTLSFASGLSGSCSAVYGDTQLVNGQISNTWAEWTFGPITVYDVSREVNMSGHSISLVGPDCVSDMNTCVFKCDSGNVCTTGYSLIACAPGSQPGAEFGLDNGAASGGCRLNTGTHITATFS